MKKIIEHIKLIYPLIINAVLLIQLPTIAQTPSFWGINSSGGIAPANVAAAGSIYSVNADGTNFNQRYCFTLTNDGAAPIGSTVQAANGKLYGMTSSGGKTGNGILFSFDPTTSVYDKVLDFGDTATNDAVFPTGNLVQADNGLLYGMTNGGGVAASGVFFSFDPVANTYSKIRNFNDTITNDAAAPFGSLFEASNGVLYGLTTAGGSSNSGVLFCYEPTLGVYTKLVNFNDTATSDAIGPYGSLMQASNGLLYGMTTGGGLDGAGIIFSYDPINFVYAKVYDFDGITGNAPQAGILIESGNNMLYGMTSSGGLNGYGVVFKYNLVANNYTVVYDFDVVSGINPWASLTLSNGKFYGLTNSSGVNDAGTIFSIDSATDAFTKLLDFNLSGTGANPYGDLAKTSNGLLYGMTYSGGTANAGVFFSFDPATNSYAKQFNFYDALAGKNPQGKPVLATNGLLYGTASGGVNGTGIVFSLDTATNIYTKLYDFGFAQGAYPNESLLQASNGKLYGTTNGGGADSAGVLFSYDINSSNYIKLFEFTGTTDGGKPTGGLLQTKNGLLYGTTQSGGDSLNGVLYSYNITTNTITKLVDFDKLTKGSLPNGGLIQARNGIIYGTTKRGGINDTVSMGAIYGGVLFSFDPATNVFTKIHDLGLDANLPDANITEAPNGILYGCTNRGTPQRTLYSYNPATNYFTKPLPFVPSPNTRAQGSYLSASNGKLYAMGGTVFSAVNGIAEYVPSTNVYNVIPISTGGNPGTTTALIENLKANDAGIVAVLYPETITCNTNITPSVLLKNWGLVALDSVIINYSIDGNTPVAIPWTGNLFSLATTIVSLPGISLSAGAHIFNAYTTLPNGVVDLNTLDDTAAIAFNIITFGSGNPLIESFDSIAFPSAGYSIYNPDYYNTWQRTTTAFYSPVASMYMNNYNYLGRSGEVDEFILPPFNLNNFSAPGLVFSLAYQLYHDPNLIPNYSDTLEILLSTDCGANYTSIYKKAGVDLTTTFSSFVPSLFIPNGNEWRQEFIDLAPFQSFNNALIKFRNITDNENNLYIDDIIIDGGEGIKDNTAHPSIEVYPNPGNGYFKIKMHNSNATNFKLTITDAIGNTILQKQFNDENNYDILDLSAQAPGIYILKATGKNGVVAKKLVVTR